MLRTILQVLPVIILSYTSQVLLKRGVNSVGAITWLRLTTDAPTLLTAIILNWYIVVGFLLGGLGAVFYLVVLSKTDFTVAFPIMGAIAFMLLPFIGKFFLQEAITPLRVVGTIVIGLGMIMVARS